MIDDHHTKDLSLALQIPSDSTHAEDAQRLSLRHQAQRRRGYFTLPRPIANCQDTIVEAAQRREDEEDGRVGRSVFYDSRDIRDVDSTPGTGVYINAVVAGAWTGWSEKK